MNLWEAWGDWCRAWRERNRLTQEEAAQLHGITASTLSKIENGKYLTQALQLLPNTLDLIGAELRIIDRGSLLPAPTNDPPNLMARILAPLDPPKSDRTYAKLFGAVVALLTDWEIILRHPTYRFSREMVDYPALLPELRRCIEEKGGINWEFSPIFIPWSKGFFRNDAQQRLALVLNRCAFWWLVAERPTEKDQWSKKNFLEWLEALQQPLSNDLLEVLNTSDEMNDAIKHVNMFTSPYRPDLKVTTVEELVDHKEMPSEVACAAIVYTLIDTALSADEQYGWAYDIEWAVTAKALFWIGAFRQTMLQHHPNIKLP